MGERSDAVSSNGVLSDDVAGSLGLADLESYTCYEDGDCFVICDRSNATAWIRSDTTAPIEQ
ncbi:DUF7331 family protein [Halocatena halophila]|uniref:DUF7331 family protein n=1 Tax=Halocatena halophila TaxID=2814576 RepID=UPI002ED2628B